MKQPVSDQVSLAVVFVVALGGAFGFGAWQGLHTPRDPVPNDVASQRYGAGALVQARALSAPDAAASRF